MNTYVISDNKFFLLGIANQENYAEGSEGSVIPVFSKNVSSTFKPCERGAVVVLFISSSDERHRITSIRALHECRVLMLVKSTGKQEYYSHSGRQFPWIVPHDIGLADLRQHIVKARLTPFYRRYFTCTEVLLFRYLTQGISIQNMANLNLSCKYLYTLKRKIILKNNIDGHDAAAIMICRDIIAMSNITLSAERAA